MGTLYLLVIKSCTSEGAPRIAMGAETCTVSKTTTTTTTTTFTTTTKWSTLSKTDTFRNNTN